MEQIDILGLDEVAAQNTAVDQIDSELVNLIVTLIDQSGSMQSYIGDMKRALSEFKDSLLNSKEVDELLLARGNFSNYSVDIGGYKKVDQYDVSYCADGGTPLYDAISEATKRLFDYMGYLKNQGMRVKAVFSVFSDGDDTSSHIRTAEAKQCITDLNNKEIVTAFVSFGGGAKTEAQTLGFKNILDTTASTSELRRAFNCLSKSVISNSQSATQKVDDFFTV
jgi:uncharacterized protein YegL